ncbi:MAG: hypothetical protein L0228_01860 [Planctomycetes bacterium]|nr:hypothetical protein [Planctomycetota bacterium]
MTNVRQSPRPPRRGVLLLVVLSMLVLFMLIGTAFLMTSNQARTSAKYNARGDRLGNRADELLDRGLMQIVRDTENPSSVIGKHSLLRDFYGTDGFEAVVASATYARQIGDNTTLGAAQGQLIDVYVVPIARPTDNTTTPTIDESITNLTLANVIKLDRDGLGRPQVHTLPLTRGYYNGCLLTVTSGAASGQTTRIVEYQFVGDDPAIQALFPNAVSITTNPPVRGIWRFRVMSFGRRDGQLLSSTGGPPPGISELAGAAFLVNGRPFNGTGVGYNPLAVTPEPRLNVLETVLTVPNPAEAIYPEVALIPNHAFSFQSDPDPNPANADLRGPRYANSLTGTYDALNPKITSNLTPAEITALLAEWKYKGIVGPGDADEGYDAADFQNMWLALQTVTPRAQGRVVVPDDTYTTDADTQPDLVDVNDSSFNPKDFLRLDLEDMPLPSFHRPDLINFWFHRLLPASFMGSLSAADRARAILRPFDDNGNPLWGLSLQQAGQIVALKRKISMRPLWEDHPEFDGGNSQSRPLDTQFLTSLGDDILKNGQIAIPYWEAVGPWDVDNDNDGVPDSNWVDLGDPVIELEDGTRVKAMYAYLIIDLDGRLNVNAHGLVDHINPVNLAYAQAMRGVVPFNLAGGASSDALPQGSGYGPAEISLRPVFPLPWADNTGLPDLNANRSERANLPIDDYATLLIGRERLDGTAVSGRSGYGPTSMGPKDAITAGQNYRYVPDSTMPTGEQILPELAAQIKFFDHPWTILNRSAFGTPPDLFGRYAMGLDYSGQPYYEVLYDAHAVAPSAFGSVNPRPLLMDSPYELNLSRSQRRDSWSSASFANAAAEFNQSLVQNDDAPYSPADLERVLRAWDADSGTLPSRLWDVVDAFDPLKLLEYDQYRMAGLSSAAFNSTGNAEMMATAQQVAGINRRLVTTDSADPPVPSGGVPNQQLLAVGPDGLPGRAGVDDDGDTTMDEADELNASVSDDFRSLFGKEVAQATIFDLLRYRAWTEVRRQVMAAAGLTETTLASQTPAQYTAFLTQVSQQTELRLNGEPYADTNSNGQIDTNEFTDLNGNSVYDPPMAQLLAPELIAGKRMDLNRPFGDGRDNNNNGVVDDPLEAGEPFLDMDGNGRRGGSEPYIDFDGNKSYTQPLDQLWADLTINGTLGEPIAFDYTNGQGELTHPSGGPAGARVRNLESQARQLYARHLYCLMRLLLDENYIAPLDANAPQIRKYLDPAESPARDIQVFLQTTGQPDPVRETQRILLRKLTCRMIAQWAVNCVDARDSDAAMTSFEYDENPWDGWGVPDGTVDNSTNPPTPTPNNIPLDGDPATDENLGFVIDWAAITAPDYLKQTKPVAAPPTILNQTRGIVWGAERPDLLITETIAVHDRRTEDLDSDFTGKDMQNEGEIPGERKDNDQRLRPRGPLFVEVYNPWSPTGQYPAELYSRLTRDPNNIVSVGTDESYGGLELGRLSTLGVNANGQLSDQIDPTKVTVATVKRSPVWRMIVVEEHTRYRNNDPVDDTGSAVHTGTPKYTSNIFESADVDWPGFKPQVVTADEPYIERSFYFTSDNSERYAKNQSPGTPLAPGSASEGFNERFLLVKKPEDKLRLPPGSTNSAPYFLAADVLKATGGNIIPDVEIAPIKPGRYAIIGTAGTQYKTLEVGRSQGFDPNGALQPINNIPRYVTTVSRLIMPGPAGDRQTDDATHKGAIDRTRRIELLPYFDPEVQQVFIGSNGGTPLFPNPGNNAGDFVQRDNEVVKLPFGPAANRFLNIFDGDNDGSPDPTLVAPCVAIPVAHMSLSEPLDLYKKRRADLYTIEKQQEQDANSQGIQVNPKDHYWNPEAAEGEGAYVDGTGSGSRFASPYDEPFDTAWELMRNGTTRNYRTLHLQRLADPTLPWNPPPGQYKDSAGNDLYRPNLPVNPYRTIDAASADLTAFNGASSREPDDPDQSVVDRNARWLPEKYLTQFRNTFGSAVLSDTTVTPVHRLSFRSLERGLHANELTPTGDIPLAPRALWRQEPEMRFDRTDTPTTPKYTSDTMNWRTLTNDTDRQTELMKRANDLRIRDRNVIDGDITAIKNLMDPDFGSFPDSLRPGSVAAIGLGHHFDIVMDHSLGFQNEAFGALATRADVQQQGLAMAATGTPLLDSEFARSTLPPNAPPGTTVNATYPWLAWGNRPFTSAKDIFNVPATSSSQMLRQYRTIHALDAVPERNPYANEVVIKDTSEWLPFGHLLNYFAVATQRPDTADIDRDTDVDEPVPPPHFYRILEYLQVPSRYVGTDTMLTAEVFNDNPFDNTDNIASAQDPRYYFQPPYNKVSRERDPGRVNLNTVAGRRGLINGVMRQWSEVFDGIMHRDRDANPAPNQLAHFGPAWRDVVLSRRGYPQVDANGASVDKPGAIPDTFAFGLNNSSPTVFANPFRSPDAGDLVPLAGMMQPGIQVSWLRSHPYGPGADGAWGVARQNPDIVGSDDDEGRALNDPLRMVDDSREAGFGDDALVPSDQSFIPLFSERFDAPFVDGNRNPSMYYQPMTRMENLVTNRSNVFAIWITVGYFEVEPAPNWDAPATQERFGGDGTAGSPATVAAQALYNRVYPDGYMLGREVGSETGDVKRPRGFYIIDRTEEVGFKPGEDLNVEKTIRLKRRIE